MERSDLELPRLLYSTDALVDPFGDDLAGSIIDEEALGRVVTTRVKRGVNLSGGSDIDNTWWSFPTTAEIQWAKRQGFEVIRVPYRWERLQPTVLAAFNATHAAALDSVVRTIVANGMIAMPVAHNFGGRGASGSSSVTGTQFKIGTATITHAHWEDFCSRLGALWADISANVWLDLMNEPESLPLNGYATTTDHLVAILNKGIAKVREAGFTGRIIVEGNGYNNAQFFDTNPWYNASSTPPTSADAFHAGIVDSLNNWIASVHNYPEPDHGNSTDPIVDATSLRTRMTNVLSWCTATGRKVVVGEFGANKADPLAEKNVRDFLDLAMSSGQVEAVVWWESRSSDETTDAYNIQTDTVPVDTRIAWMRDLDNQVVADVESSVVEFDGASAGAASVSATTIVRRRTFSGTAACTSSVSATTIARKRNVSGAAAGTSTTTSSCAVRRSVAASAAGATTTSGAAAVRRSIASSVAGTGASSATTIVRKRNIAGATAGTATTTSAVQVRRPFAVAVAGLAAVAASLVAVRPLAGASNGSSAVTSTLARRRALATTIVGTSTVTGSAAIRRPFAVTVVGTSSVAGETAGSGIKTFAGSTVGTGVVSASLARFRGLTGSSLGSGLGNASGLNVARRMAGTATGSSTASATTLRRARALSAIVAGSAAASSSLSLRRQLLASSSGVSSATASVLGRRRSISATCASTSSASGLLFLPTGYRGTAAGMSTASAAMRVTRAFASNVVGTSTCSASTITRRCAMTALASGVGVCTSSFIAARSFAGTIAGTSAALAQLAVVGTTQRGHIEFRFEESAHAFVHACETVLVVFSVRGAPMGLKVGATATLHIGLRYKGQRYDATTLAVTLRAPSGAMTSYTLAEATRIRKGDYVIHALVNEPKKWQVVVECTMTTPYGTIRGSDDGQFDVEALPFTPPS